jgi:hypothetical protein
MTEEETQSVDRCNIQQDLFADDLQNKMPFSRVLKSGPYVFVTFEHSTWAMQQVAPDVYDINGQFEDEEAFSKEGLSQEDVEYLFQKIYFQENPESIPSSPTWEDNEPVSENAQTPDDPQQFPPVKGSAARVESPMSERELDEYIASVLSEYSRPITEDAQQSAEDAEENPTMHGSTPTTGSATPTNESTGFMFQPKKPKRPLESVTGDGKEICEDDDMPTTGSAVSEQSTTGDVAGYSPANAFSDPRQKINRGTEQSKREGWRQVTVEDGSLIVCSGSMASPQSQDPQQQRTPMNEAVNWKTKKLLNHLREVLPISEDDIFLDASGSDAFPQTNIVIEKDNLTLRILTKGASLFDVETMVGSRRLPRKTALSYSKMLQYVFDACGAEDVTAEIVNGIGKPKKTPLWAPPESDEDFSYSDAYETLKELAVSSGAYGGDDILRNHSLVDLRALVVSKNKSITPQPYPTLREQLSARFDRQPMGQKKTTLRETIIPRHLRADKLKGGAPISLNENRDVSRPYGNTLGGKKLIMHPIHGAIFVDKAELPEGKKLSYDPVHGAIMINESEETKRGKNMWKPYWQSDY